MAAGGLVQTMFAVTMLATQPVEAGPAMRVLFVGNSYTHGSFAPLTTFNHANITDVNGTGYGGVPGMFKQLTESAGLDYQVSIEASSGTTLAQHLDHHATVIFQPHWDLVFLQEHSRGALPTKRGGNPDEFLRATRALAKGVHKANPRTRIILYETFPRADMTYPIGQPYHGEPIESMGRDLRAGYERAAQTMPDFCTISPAGDAWVYAIQSELADRNPYDGDDSGKINLWAEDQHHASAAGCFLNALVLFGTATGRDPRTLGFEKTAENLGLTPEVALTLQTVAHTTLTNTRPSLLQPSQSQPP